MISCCFVAALGRCSCFSCHYELSTAAVDRKQIGYKLPCHREGGTVGMALLLFRLIDQSQVGAQPRSKLGRFDEHRLQVLASVAIFAFVDAALIKPLPYANPSRVMGVYETNPLCPKCNLSYLDYLDWKKAGTVFSSFEAWGYSNYLVRMPEGTQRAPGVRVSDGFFRTLGVKPIQGRDFYAGEDSPGAPRTVLLSNAAWKQRYGGRADVVGQPVTLDDETYTIIGVLPAEFHFAPRGQADFWTTIHDPKGAEKAKKPRTVKKIS